MAYTPPNDLFTSEEAILSLASSIADEDRTNLGNGTINGALDVLADALADQNVEVPPMNAGAILALADYVSGGGGGGEDKEFIASLKNSHGFQPFTGTLSVGGDAISYTVETFFAGTEDEFEGAVASVPAGSIVTYAPVQGGIPASDNSMMNVFESKEAFLSRTTPPILSVPVSDSVVVPASNFLFAMFDVTR